MAMVAVKCPQCGADVEIDGAREFGYCNFCGTKIMQEKVIVEHKGNVKIDNSEQVEKYLQNARRAKQKEDWEETERYYNLVEENDPSNIEAIFYSAYGKAKQSLVDSDIYKRQSAFNVLVRCVSIIDDNYSVDNEERDKPIIEQIGNDIKSMANSQYVYNKIVNGYGYVKSTDKDKTVVLFLFLNETFVDSLINISEKYPSDDKRKIFFYEIALNHLNFILKNYSFVKGGADELKEKTLSLHRKWNRLDSSHVVPQAVTTAQEDQKAAAQERAGNMLSSGLKGDAEGLLTNLGLSGTSAKKASKKIIKIAIVLLSIGAFLYPCFGIWGVTHDAIGAGVFFIIFGLFFLFLDILLVKRQKKNKK